MAKAGSPAERAALQRKYGITFDPEDVEDLLRRRHLQPASGQSPMR